MKTSAQRFWLSFRRFLSLLMDIATIVGAVKGAKYLYPYLRDGLVTGRIPTLLMGLLGVAILTAAAIGFNWLMLLVAPDGANQELCFMMWQEALTVLILSVFASILLSVYALYRGWKSGQMLLACIRIAALLVLGFLPGKVFVAFAERMQKRIGIPDWRLRRGKSKPSKYDGFDVCDEQQRRQMNEQFQQQQRMAEQTNNWSHHGF